MIDLSLATPEEAQRYLALLQEELAKKSPLDLACLLFPETRRWPHLELLNEHLLALVQYRLTEKGPVPEEQVQWWYTDRAGNRHVAEGPAAIPETVKAYGAFDTESGDPIVFRLAISMMPRAGKSRLVTETFPVWLLLQDPEIQVGLGTYSDTFAWDWGGAMRDLMLAKYEEFPFLPQPRDGQRSPREVFQVRGHEGKIRYTGTGGSVTGKTLHVLIGDDFLKGDDDAQSEATRSQIHRFLQKVWWTRRTRNLKPGAFLPIPVELMMATRWHQLDPTGFACFDPETGERKPGWCYLNIPALATADDPEDDPLHREQGEGHPNAAGLNEADLAALREDDPRTFAALYQGNPTPEGGGMISTDFGTFVRTSGADEGSDILSFREPVHRRKLGEEVQSRSVSLRDCVLFAAADMAATAKTSSDFTVQGIFAYDREADVLMILDWYRKRITTDQYQAELVPMLDKHGCRIVAVENVTYGQTYGQGLEAERKFTVEFMPTGSDKVARAASGQVSRRVRSGRLLVPEGAWFVPALKVEAGLFPYGDFDDQVDVLSFACLLADDLPAYRPAKEQKPPTLAEEIEEHVMKQGRRRRSDSWSRISRR